MEQILHAGCLIIYVQPTQKQSTRGKKLFLKSMWHKFKENDKTLELLLLLLLSCAKSHMLSAR